MRLVLFKKFSIRHMVPIFVSPSELNFEVKFMKLQNVLNFSMTVVRPVHKIDLSSAF